MVLCKGTIAGDVFADPQLDGKDSRDCMAVMAGETSAEAWSCISRSSSSSSSESSLLLAGEVELIARGVGACGW